MLKTTESDIEPPDDNARARHRLAQISLKKAFGILVLTSIPIIALLFWLNKSIQTSKLNIEILSILIFYVSISGLIYYAFAKKKVSLFGIFSKLENSRELLLFIPLMTFSIGAFWSTLVIFNRIDPSLGQWYFNDTESLDILNTSSHTYYYQYFGIFLLVAVLVPFIEEVVFRGIFIERLGTKFNYKTGLITSAIIFGILHTDLIGAIMFGLILGVIYLKSKSLTVPVLLHMLNNGFLFFIVMIEDQFLPPQKWGDTMQDFVDYGYLGILLFIISALPLIMYLKQNWHSALSGNKI